jgi:hypothetical protein
MAEFPAITPDQRSYSLGRIPTAEHVGASGIAYLSRVGTLAVGQTLELPYDYRPAAELSQIVDHHENQHGDPFTLPAAIWCGHAGGDAIADVSLRWIYTTAPEPEPAGSGRFYRLTVSLLAVGVTIGPTVSGPVLSGGDAGSIIGAALPALPPRALLALLPLVPLLPLALLTCGALAMTAAQAADPAGTPGGKGAQVYCFMRSAGNSHDVSWAAAYALIKRQSASMFKTSPEHAAVMITEAVVQNPGTFPDCGRYLGDLYTRRVEPLPNGTSTSTTTTPAPAGGSAGTTGMTRSERYN